MSYIYDLADTWNNAATTFTAIKMDVTNTASNAASLLMDLQVGGVSKAKIDNLGAVNFSQGIGYCAGNAAGSAVQYAQLGSNTNLGLGLSSVSPINWYPNAPISGSADLILTRRGAANLRFGAADAAAPVAQTLSVQSVVAGTTNTAGAALTITGSQGTGTGVGGSITFQVAPAGGSGTAQNALTTAWNISGAGHFLAGSDNAYDIGASGATRPRRVYVGSDIRAPIVYFGAGLSNLSGASNNALLQDASGSNFSGVFQFGGTTSSFPALKRSSTTLQARLADDSGFASVQGKLTTDTAYTAGDPTTTGYLVVYDSTGAAYKIPALAV